MESNTKLIIYCGYPYFKSEIDTVLQFFSQ